MKKKILSIIILFAFVSLFAEEWQITEKEYNQTYHFYVNEEAPENYAFTKGTTVFATYNNHSYRNLFSVSLKDKMLDYLEQEKFKIENEDGVDCIFLLPEFLDFNFEISKRELESIYKILKNKYVAFSDMKKKGFSKEEFFQIHNSNELKSYLDKYIEDCHFNLCLREMNYGQNLARDEGCFESKDSYPTYFEKETSNAYYVRFNNCTSKEYNSNFEKIYKRMLDKDFLILDARSNGGGSNWPQNKLKAALEKNNYKGSVLILQDNWSYSSGEVWGVFGQSGVKLNCKLVGTHSGGMQFYGNCRTISDKKTNVMIYCGRTSFRNYLPANYLGEGKGYEPDIWATTETMKATLEGLGVDLTGIDFQ